MAIRVDKATARCDDCRRLQNIKTQFKGTLFVEREAVFGGILATGDLHIRCVEHHSNNTADGQHREFTVSEGSRFLGEMKVSSLSTYSEFTPRDKGLRTELVQDVDFEIGSTAYMETMRRFFRR